jgi:hypothetical protein
MVISSPTLVSSSAKIGGTPLTPSDSPIDVGVAKALEKASGSGSKMSMRWRKLGFKRGPSMSNSPDIYTPPTSSTPQPSRLEEPIALKASSPPLPWSAPLAAPATYTSADPGVTSPDLNATGAFSWRGNRKALRSGEVTPGSAEVYVAGAASGADQGSGSLARRMLLSRDRSQQRRNRPVASGKSWGRSDEDAVMTCHHCVLV